MEAVQVVSKDLGTQKISIEPFYVSHGLDDISPPGNNVVLVRCPTILRFHDRARHV
jgi:hypothetical protein